MSVIDRRAFLGTAAAAGFVTAQSANATEEVSAEELSQLGRTPHTKFAVNIEMWWKKLPFMERIKQAAAFGYPAYEFWPWERQDIDAMAALSQGLNDPKNHANFVKKIEEGCAAAKKLNCKKMTVVGGNDQPGMTQKEMHENIITGLKLAAPIAEANDIMLILEAMNIRVDHWDLYHMQITEGDLCGHLREGMKAGQIGYLQLADTPGRNEPGTGEIHYNRVLKEAYDLGYRDFLGLECRPKTTELAAAQGVAAADVW